MSADRPRLLALVTGASSGLGEAFARAYAARGLDLAIVARRQDRLEALARELRDRHAVEVLVVPADLAVWEAHVTVMDAVAQAGRSVDVLVNNAGFSIPQVYGAVPWRRQRDFIMTLVLATSGFAHAVLPGMLAAGRGRILNIASLAGFSPGAAGHTLYPAAKSYAIKLSQSLDAEYREKGIRITAVCPGFTKTGFHEANGTQELMDQAPRHFWQTSKEVVESAIAANDRGRVVHVPGWHNKIAAAIMKYLPDGLVARLIRAGAAKYRVKD